MNEFRKNTCTQTHPLLLVICFSLSIPEDDDNSSEVDNLCMIDFKCVNGYASRSTTSISSESSGVVLESWWRISCWELLEEPSMKGCSFHASSWKHVYLYKPCNGYNVNVCYVFDRKVFGD